MYILQGQVVTDCIGCVDHAVRKDWGGLVSCVVMVAIGSIVRHFEKSRIMKKEAREKGKKEL